MESKINREELEAIEHFMARASQGKLHQQLQTGDYAQDDIDRVFPAIRKLLEFGAKHVNNAPHDYKLYYTNSQGSPMLLFGLTVNNPEMIQNLLTHYRAIEQMALKEKLFAMKISDMTGAEFAQYLTLLEPKKSIP
ncbi:hypothetical protein [Larkinella punicea]|uniref:Uncharacterized protein n=1 Tax=Larkinella punicea TaxID=2315727 RepID=A0A368JII4_9BACT|nr:hypothetical protein [Larkinella punicea]RCR67467.1 hypothetical protein DUE52_21945 [Larkinella punicea]